MSDNITTASDLETYLDTTTDAAFADIVDSLPSDWTTVTPIGKTISKRRLRTCIWGRYKDDESVLAFLKDILLAYPPEPTCPTIFDTLNVNSIADNRNTIWHRSVHSVTHPNGLPHPLASDLTIFQIHEVNHYTTLIYDANGMHHYNSIAGNNLPIKVKNIRKRLGRHYRDRDTPPAHSREYGVTSGLHQRTRTMETPTQTDAFTCAMHMLAVTLACTYQNRLPTLPYSDADIQMLHRCHLRHYITGRLGSDTCTWLAGFVALLKQPTGTREYNPPPTWPSAGGSVLNGTPDEGNTEDTDTDNPQSIDTVVTTEQQRTNSATPETGYDCDDRTPEHRLKRTRNPQEDGNPATQTPSQAANCGTTCSVENSGLITDLRKLRPINSKEDTLPMQKKPNSGNQSRNRKKQRRTAKPRPPSKRVLQPPNLKIPLRTTQTTLFDGCNPAVPIASSHHSDEPYEYDDHTEDYSPRPPASPALCPQSTTTPPPAAHTAHCTQTDTVRQQGSATVRESASAEADYIKDTTPDVPHIDKDKYTRTNLTLCTLNVRGMHSTIVDVIQILNGTRIPDVFALTETKHSHVNSIWRETLQHYKIHHNVPELHTETNRRSAGTILAVNRRKFKQSRMVEVPAPLRNHITAAIVEPHAGTSMLIISLYMPQLTNQTTKFRYSEILEWLRITTEITYPQHDIYVGGDFQASPDPSSRSYYSPLSTLSTLVPLNDPSAPTFQPAQTPLDHWLARRTQVQPRYRTRTHIQRSACSDHSAVIIQIHEPNIYLPKTRDPNPAQSLATTRTFPKFQLPVDNTLVQMYQLGDPELRQHTDNLKQKIDALTNKPQAHTMDRYTIDGIAEDITNIISGYYTLAQDLWPTRQPSHASSTAHCHQQQEQGASRGGPNKNLIRLKPPLSKSELRSINRLTRLRNETAKANRNLGEFSAGAHTETGPHPAPLDD